MGRSYRYICIGRGGYAVLLCTVYASSVAGGGGGGGGGGGTPLLYHHITGSGKSLLICSQWPIARK